MPSNTDLTQRAYDAVAVGDLAALTDFLSPDCTWVVGGDNTLSGRYVGRQATFAYFARLQALTEGTLRSLPQSVTAIDDTTVLVVARVSAAVRGEQVDELMVQLIEMRDGQAVSARGFVENGQRWDALFGPAVIDLSDRQVSAR